MSGSETVVTPVKVSLLAVRSVVTKLQAAVVAGGFVDMKPVGLERVDVERVDIGFDIAFEDVVILLARLKRVV